jgi:CRP/FNR family transcriptional regulator, cyclic AMP receptor protein
MSSDLEQALSSVDLLSGLSGRQRRKLVDAGSEVTSQAGKEIATEGLGALALHVVLEGALEVTLRGETIRTLGPGDYFGEISMIDGRPRSATVTATAPSRTFAIPHSTVAGLLEKDAELANALLVALCGRLREAEARR